MTTYVWRTRLDGIVEVSADGGEFHIPRLTSPRLLSAFDRARGHWESTVAPIAEQYQVPLSWAVAVIACESGGYPAVVSKAGAVGLMQLMPTTAGLTKEELLDPITNLRAGCKELSRLRHALSQPDLPAVASGYNAGFDPKARAPWPNEHSAERVRTPWGYRGEPTYIDSVVAASNEYLLRAQENAPSTPGPVPPPLISQAEPASAPPSSANPSDRAPSSPMLPVPPQAAGVPPTDPAPGSVAPTAGEPVSGRVTKIRLDRVLLVAGAILLAYKLFDYYRTTSRLERLAADEMTAMPDGGTEPLVP